jgi:hypothetical protein
MRIPHEPCNGINKKFGKCFFKNILFSETNNAQQTGAVATAAEENLGFDRNPNTLTERLRSLRFPKRYSLDTFCNKQTFIELQLTHNETFQHVMAKVNASKSRKVHCALCHFGQTDAVYAKLLYARLKK